MPTRRLGQTHALILSRPIYYQDSMALSMCAWVQARCDTLHCTRGEWPNTLQFNFLGGTRNYPALGLVLN